MCVWITSGQSLMGMKAKPHLEQAGCEPTPEPQHTFVLHRLSETVGHASEMHINGSVVGKPGTLCLFKRDPGGFRISKGKPR